MPQEGVLIFCNVLFLAGKLYNIKVSILGKIATFSTRISMQKCNIKKKKMRFFDRTHFPDSFDWH